MKRNNPLSIDPYSIPLNESTSFKVKFEAYCRSTCTPRSLPRAVVTVFRPNFEMINSQSTRLSGVEISRIAALDTWLFGRSSVGENNCYTKWEEGCMQVYATAHAVL